MSDMGKKEGKKEIDKKDTKLYRAAAAAAAAACLLATSSLPALFCNFRLLRVDCKENLTKEKIYSM
jgi:hypothetical protein